MLCVAYRLVLSQHPWRIIDTRLLVDDQDARSDPGTDWHTLVCHGTTNAERKLRAAEPALLSMFA